MKRSAVRTTWRMPGNAPDENFEKKRRVEERRHELVKLVKIRAWQMIKNTERQPASQAEILSSRPFSSSSNA